MKLANAALGHLTYCSNIHPGETWPEVFSNLQRHLPAIKGKVAAGREMGVGLRLSAIAAEALSEPEALAEFQDFLERNGLYVFTIGWPTPIFWRTFWPRCCRTIRSSTAASAPCPAPSSRSPRARG
jgi:hypothetical protein